MYLFSAYFDEKTNAKLQYYINKIAKETGNTFMTDNHVPPHITISAMEARDVDVIKACFLNVQNKLQSGKIQLVSVGMLLPYVLYVTPVLNSYLQDLSGLLYTEMELHSEISINKFYKPMQWLPHVTMEKTLTKEQMQRAIGIMQESFSPLEGEIVRFGLAKTNPHEDICTFVLP